MTGPRGWNSTLPARTVPLARGVSLARHTGLGNGTAAKRNGRTVPTRRNTGPSGEVRELVLERDGYACVCCGVSVIGRPHSLQHRKRRSQGGGNSPSNLITVLGTGTTGCHERIDSRRDPADEVKGYTVRSWQGDPAFIRVKVFSGTGAWRDVWLTDDGQYRTGPPQGRAALWNV